MAEPIVVKAGQVWLRPGPRGDEFTVVSVGRTHARVETQRSSRIRLDRFRLFKLIKDVTP